MKKQNVYGSTKTTFAVWHWVPPQVKETEGCYWVVQGDFKTKEQAQEHLEFLKAATSYLSKNLAIFEETTTSIQKKVS